MFLSGKWFCEVSSESRPKQTWTQPSGFQQDREISTTGKVPDDTLALGLVKYYAVECKRGYRGGL